MNILSLFDGMSCGQIALTNLGLKDYNYYASEIKPYGIKATQENFPNTIQIGDVTKVSYKDGFLKTEKGVFNVGEIDLLMGGSPCQNFSIACISEKRLGLEGEKSKLFYEYLRILNECKPKYFLLENVASMDKKSKQQLDEYLHVEGVAINSKDFLPHLRNRLYWTNINFKDNKILKSHLTFNDILESGFNPRKNSTCLLEGHSRPNSDKLRMVRRDLEKGLFPVVYESEQHYNELLSHYNQHYKGKTANEVNAIRVNVDNSIYDKCRMLTNKEMERLQGVTEGYTKNLTRNEAASLLGDGWTIPVIEHILKTII